MYTRIYELESAKILFMYPKKYIKFLSVMNLVLGSMAHDNPRDSTSELDSQTSFINTILHSIVNDINLQMQKEEILLFNIIFK